MISRTAAIMVAMMAVVGLAPPSDSAAGRPARQTPMLRASVAEDSCGTSSVASCTAPSQGSIPDPAALIGSAAPPATGRNLTGRGTLSLAELYGKPTAVVFWLNTCPHCRQALPQVNRLKATLENGQVITAAIDAHQRGPKGFETPSAAVQTLHLRLPTILVANDVAQTQWRVASTPTAYIIDSSGKITQVLQNAHNLAQSIKDALAQTN